jgi:hypothetical protein
MDKDRKKQLEDFVAYAKTLNGDEKGEAQVFLDRLFRGFSRGGYKQAGATLEYPVKKQGGTTGFADLVWKPIVLIEMKKRGEDLSRHLSQAFRYWEELVPNRPRYVVLCNFDEFRIYDFDQDIHQPQDTLTLDELPDRYGPLNFLWPTNEKAHFLVDRDKATREAADLLAKIYRTLRQRKAATPEVCQRFALQALVCLFSEDIGLLPKHFFTALLDDCVDPPKAFDLLDGLFRAMNARDGAKGGRYKPVPYFNGGIFAHSAAIELDPHQEVALLKRATKFNWAHVSPDIFGTIFQHSMEAEERHAMGAHYTSQVDIMRIVGPTIVYPFTTAIDRADSLRELTAIRERLTTLRVLDPACGSGNFLYIAYREMRRLEAAIIAKQSVISRHTVTGQSAFAAVSPSQFFGMDVLPFAVELAKVTLSLAPKLASDELQTAEKTLPLDNLDKNIMLMDALVDPRMRAAVGENARRPVLWVRSEWPAADVIIGNPPFLGSRYLAKEQGYEYARKVSSVFPEVPRMSDFCVYWFRRSHDHLPVCTPKDPFAGRAGLVGTQNIRNNDARVGGLDHIVKSGTIIEAVENMPWSGEANVHVSIANWVKTSPSKSPEPEHGTSPQPDGLTDNSWGQSNVRRRRTSATRGKDSAVSPDRERVEPVPVPINEPSLLIPSPRRLWSKVDPKLALFDQDNPKPNPKVVTTGKRGKLRKDKSYEMAVRECAEINSALSDTINASTARVLACNTKPQQVFQGQNPANDQFMLTPSEARLLLKQDAKLKDVIFPYMIGRDLVEDCKPSRYIIDFAKRDMLSAARYAAAFERIKTLVMPQVLAKAKAEQKATGAEKTRWSRMADRWWQFRDYQPGTMKAIARIPRYIVCSRTTKRPIFAFVSRKVHPDTKLMVFPFADDFSFGVLQSSTHWIWFVTKSSKLTERFNYTPSSVFDTFPWPQSPTKKQIKQVAAAGRAIRAIRAKTLPTIKGGLRALYRTLELPGKNPLKDAHAALDAAVLDAYGFSPNKDLLKQLLDLNLAVASAIDAGEQVTPPGVPTSYGDPADLITDDCIKPD